MEKQLPRRINAELNNEAELSIRKAMTEVEKLPPNEKLTKAVMLLSEAFELVADYSDEYMPDSVNEPVA